MVRTSVCDKHKTSQIILNVAVILGETPQCCKRLRAAFMESCVLQIPTRLPLLRSCCVGQSLLMPSSAAAGGSGRPSAQAGARGSQTSLPVLMASPLSSICRHSPPLSNGIIIAGKGCAVAASAYPVSSDPQAMPACQLCRECREGCLSCMSCCCGVQVS